MIKTTWATAKVSPLTLTFNVGLATLLRGEESGAGHWVVAPFCANQTERRDLTWLSRTSQRSDGHALSASSAEKSSHLKFENVEFSNWMIRTGVASLARLGAKTTGRAKKTNKETRSRQEKSRVRFFLAHSCASLPLLAWSALGSAQSRRVGTDAHRDLAAKARDEGRVSPLPSPPLACLDAKKIGATPAR